MSFHSNPVVLPCPLLASGTSSVQGYKPNAKKFDTTFVSPHWPLQAAQIVWWIPPLTHTHIPSPLCLHPSHAGQATTCSARCRSGLWPGFHPSPSNPFFIYSQKQPFFSFCFLSFFLIFQKYFTFSLFKKFFHCGKIHITILTIFKCKYIYIIYIATITTVFPQNSCHLARQTLHPFNNDCPCFHPISPSHLPSLPPFRPSPAPLPSLW